MPFVERVDRATILTVLASLIFLGFEPHRLRAQQAGAQQANGSVQELPVAEPSSIALPLAEDRGSSGTGAEAARHDG